MSSVRWPLNYSHYTAQIESKLNFKSLENIRRSRWSAYRDIRNGYGETEYSFGKATCETETSCVESRTYISCCRNSYCIIFKIQQNCSLPCLENHIYSYCETNCIFFYLVATAYTQAIFTALVSIPNYRSSGIITYAHENVTSDEQSLVSWIRHINLKGALRLLSHAKLKERQWHCSQIVVNFAEISSVITNSLTNSWSACDYATFGGRVHVAPARMLMLSCLLYTSPSPRD